MTARWVAPFGNRVNAAIMKHAASHPDEEICGMVLAASGGWQYRKLENKAAVRRDAFFIDRAQLPTTRSPAAIVHSHPNGLAFPSFADMRQQAASAVPWGIVVPPPHPDRGVFWFGDGITYPLMRRPYRHGVTDCYALIRDWYAAKAGLALIDRPRHWNWWQQGDDLYAAYFEQAGFYRLDDDARLQRGDIALAALLSPVLNHAMILLDDGLILHHPAGRHGFDAMRLPRVEPVERWRRYLQFWVRHKSWQKG